MFASEWAGLRPDVMCLGKGITGGYLPMSVTAASERVFDAFLGADLSTRTFFHGHSYGGNALAASVALEHLRLFERWNVLDQAAAAPLCFSAASSNATWSRTGRFARCGGSG